MVLGRVNADKRYSAAFQFLKKRNKPVLVFIVNCDWLLQFWHTFLFPEAPPVPCEKPKKKAAHFERPRFQSESKIYEKLLSTGRSRVHVHIQQHMTMLLAEAGLVNEWCIRIFKMLHPAREDSQIYLFARSTLRPGASSRDRLKLRQIDSQ